MSHTPTDDRRDWLARFFASWYRLRPVDASFIGVREHDGRLPDASESRLGDALAEMRHLLATAPARSASDGRPLAADADGLDVRLASGALRLAIEEVESGRQHARNPAFYTGEAVFGLMALFLHREAPGAEGIEAAVERISAVPDLLRQGRENVRGAPTGWTERALRECDGGLALFGDGVARLVADERIVHPRFLREAERAAAAFAEHRAHLEAALAGADPGDPGCGEEAFALHLREAHFVDEPAEEIAAYAEETIAEADAETRRAAAELGAAEPSEALARLSELHPDLDAYLPRYGETWARMRDAALEHDLVTWPDFPIRYVPRPAWTRAAAPHLYFLFYRSPAAFGRPPVHDYFVTPIDASLPPEERERLLRAHDDGVIKLNHVVHHGGLGHHVQNWHAFRAASRVGRVAAVDCAARIAMLCGGTMAEGWACYATDLMAEVGALTPLEALAERHARIRMAARALVDARLHAGRFSAEEAVAYYRRTAGMSEAAARAEVVKNGMFPGGAVMYLLGTDAIHRLRGALERRVGSGFSLRGFHDAFLAHGSVPVSLIAEKMTWEAGRPAAEEAPDVV